MGSACFAAERQSRRTIATEQIFLTNQTHEPALSTSPITANKMKKGDVIYGNAESCSKTSDGANEGGTDF
jgi:hypothetical protein